MRTLAKPFLKWPGGKSQLIGQFEDYFPLELKNAKINNYFEPFVGSGAIFFYIIQKYKIKRSFLYDINKDLILVYKTVQNDVKKLIKRLQKYEKEYLSLDEEKRQVYFYEIRKNFNRKRGKIDYAKFSPNWLERGAQLIFLNKTCFNGLFRFNQKNEFNSPYGKYLRPKICDPDNLQVVSEVLKDVVIEAADFNCFTGKITKSSFVYLDPPYRPISKSSSFTSYSKFVFNDEEQKRLGKIFDLVSKKGAKVMLSNSDPQNQNPDDKFFDELYKNYFINKVSASRMINCIGSKRGKIKELLITNYSPNGNLKN